MSFIDRPAVSTAQLTCWDRIAQLPEELGAATLHA